MYCAAKICRDFLVQHICDKFNNNPFCWLLLMFLYNRRLYIYVLYYIHDNEYDNMFARSETTYKLPPTIIKVCRFSTFIMFTSYVPNFYYSLNIKQLSIQFKQTSVTPGVLKVYRPVSSRIMKW